MPNHPLVIYRRAHLSIGHVDTGALLLLSSLPFSVGKLEILEQVCKDNLSFSSRFDRHFTLTLPFARIPLRA